MARSAAQGIRTIWGVPLVETDAVPAGTAIVGDWKKAVLFDREELNISLGTVNDDFVRNIIRVLAEARLGFFLTRPSAFIEVTLA